MRSRFDRLAQAALMSLAVSIPACSHPTGDGASPRPDPSVITHQTLLDNHFNTAYEAVESLRSNWLLTKGSDSFSTPTEVRVYLNNTLLGGIQTLREIGTTSVAYIRHYDGIAATARWGLGHGAGVIFVSTRADTGDPISGAPIRPPTN